MSEPLRQPPPGIDPPPLGPEAQRSQQVMRLILWLGLGSLGILLVMGMFSPLVLRSKRAADGTEAINNIKQIGLALQDFEADYGRFPDATTAPLVKAKTGTPLTLGVTSSNDFFRQLLATTSRSEKMFYAKTARSKKPDDIFKDDAHALTPGECGFAYVAGLSSSGNPRAPVALTPMIPGTTCFDPKIHAGKAVILQVDCAAMPVNIDRSGHAVISGVDLLDPHNPIWSSPPDLKWQE